MIIISLEETFDKLEGVGVHVVGKKIALTHRAFKGLSDPEKLAPIALVGRRYGIKLYADAERFDRAKCLLCVIDSGARMEVAKMVINNIAPLPKLVPGKRASILDR